MKDNLEDFIRKHRQEFDDLEPRTDTWGKIQGQLGQGQKKDQTWIWKVAAAVFLCLSIGLALDRTIKSDVAEVAEIENGAIEGAASELDEVESYYSQLISQKRGEIQLVIEKKGLNDVELLEDLDQLDAMYSKLKNDLKRNQNDERLINAMIQNLQLRVEILNKQLKVLERISKYEEDEKISA